MPSVSEIASAKPEYGYAGFWIRVGACLIDQAILTIPCLLVEWVGRSLPGQQTSEAVSPLRQPSGFRQHSHSKAIRLTASSGGVSEWVIQFGRVCVSDVLLRNGIL
jgi:hypothetical protein